MFQAFYVWISIEIFSFLVCESGLTGVGTFSFVGVFGKCLGFGLGIVIASRYLLSIGLNS